MFSSLQNIYTYFLGKKEDQCDEAEEEFLAQQLLNLEIESAEAVVYENDTGKTLVQNDCFERTGTVSYLADNHGLIDGMIYFEKDCTSSPLDVGEKVRYLAQRTINGDSIKVIKIVQKLGYLWEGEQVDSDEKKYDTKKHQIVGKVDHRDQRVVVLKENDIRFSLDDVESSIVPCKGDWLDLTCKVQWDDESPFDVQGNQVVEVLSVKPLRSRITTSKIQHWNGSEGSCIGHIYFSKNSCRPGFYPTIGTKVYIEAIESDQGACSWRAINVVPVDILATDSAEILETDEEISITVEDEKNLSVTKHITLNNVDYNEKQSTTLEIKNNSSNAYTLLKWKLMANRHSSQVVVEPVISKRTFIHPDKSLKFTITCRPKVLGSSQELLVFVFHGFQIKRYINLSVINATMKLNSFITDDIRQTSQPYKNKTVENIRTLQQRRQNESFVVGVRPVKPPSFVPVKLPGFPIPNKIWDAVLGDSEKTIYSNEFQATLLRMEQTIPSLSAQLNIANYTDRLHALLYIEEIQQNLEMRKYDMPKTFLIPSDNFLKLEIKGLSEKRPSLMCGDRVYVKDIWDPSVPEYEGYIHNIRGDNAYIRFNAEFHERYTGYDVKIEFHFSRTAYRRCHQAVNLAISHLGPNILFPSQIVKNQPQIDSKKIESLSCYNEKLNPGQIEAVKNILQGLSRPMPFCIFGPPGTGKTITVVETVLQIINNIPDSRILIATPSNSSANLLTERLLQYKSKISGSLIRLIAHHLIESGTLPDAIKPYCATLDIARESTAKCNYSKNDAGMNLSCRANFVGRHRITIGTCGCLGALAQMDLPRGHFTHVLIDEAGQATEPEIMIPMTFIDKDCGQVILAGDPLQLGPVVLSKYSREFGYDISYLERLLERVPYQKDFESFGETGYDKRLITRLTYNYRSVPGVIGLCSDVFYDSCLIPQVKNEDEWVKMLLRNISDVLPKFDNTKKGGIYMYGIKGMNARAVDSPSWFNPQEATMLLLHTCKLYKRNVVPDQIGVITPYIAQIKYLRKLFDSTGTPQPKIGTVEEFQGQERDIILLSTVRSSEAYLETDYKFSLGFVKSPKRLNVALTRARVIVILFGDPALLSRDVLWRKVINCVVQSGQYIGCNLPSDLLLTQ